MSDAPADTTAQGPDLTIGAEDHHSQAHKPPVFGVECRSEAMRGYFETARASSGL